MSKAEDAQGAALLAVQQASEAGPGCMLRKLACVPRWLHRERDRAPAMPCASSVVQMRNIM